MTQHANLAAMIEAARRTEAGFNLSMSKTGISTSELPAKNYITPTPLAVEMSHEKTNKDLNNLAQQIQQLTLNYANLSSALIANANLYSGGLIQLANSNTVNGNITAANSGNAGGSLFQFGKSG